MTSRLAHGARALVPFAGAVLVAASLSCSSGEPTAPPGQVPGTDTYLLATITVLDVALPCVAGDCDPEFYDCRDLSPRFAGDTYTMTADIVTAGFTTTTEGTTQKFVVTGSDLATRVGVALEIDFERTGGMTTDPLTGEGTLAADTNGTFGNVFLDCNRLNDTNRPESHFEYNSNSTPRGSVDLTEVTLTPDQLGVVRAVPVGSTGRFNPEGIVAGTFSFEGTGIQEQPSAPLTPKVRVTGCFRVNLPPTQQGVPATPNPSSPAAGCP